ncbi:MAG: DUF4416 family protein [Candidatus Eisenbacteria bacterium]
MARRRTRPSQIKIFCGLIGCEESFAQAADLLTAHFGDIDCESPVLPFDFTQYYRDEMGDGLLRKWIAFRELRERAFLSRAKHLAIRTEQDLAQGEMRTVNIDPGYVDDAQVVLATAKNFSHRIYVGMGYYAEVTLIYRDKDFRPVEWTYPDYKSPEGLGFFRKVRKAYHTQVRSDSDS